MSEDKVSPKATEIEDAALDQASGGKIGAGQVVLGGTLPTGAKPTPPPSPRPGGIVKTGPGTLA